MPPTPTAQRQPRPRVDEVLPGATGDATSAGGAESATPAAVVQGEAPVGSRVVLPTLPRTKTSLTGVLEDKTVLLYGPAGIGKSTLASEWAGGDMLFFDCAGELNDLEVYRLPTHDWTAFRAGCASYKADMEGDKPGYRGCVIDTADMLGTFCSQHMRKRLGVVHESDAEWGKGWSMVREEFASHLAKLAAMPGGVLLVSHSNSKEIKKRNEVYDRSVPTLTGGVRDACINMADLVLFIDWADGEVGGRMIYTKPSKHHEAKERGKTPRLPAEIAWPLGTSGYDVLSAAWHSTTT